MPFFCQDFYQDFDNVWLQFFVHFALILQKKELKMNILTQTTQVAHSANATKNNNASKLARFTLAGIFASVFAGIFGTLAYAEPTSQDIQKQIEALKKENELLELERKNQSLKDDDLQRQINDERRKNQSLKGANQRERERE